MRGGLERLIGYFLVCVAIMAEDERCIYWTHLGLCHSNTTVAATCPRSCQKSWPAEQHMVVDVGTSLLAMEDAINSSKVERTLPSFSSFSV
jgi:hypothetical protein